MAARAFDCLLLDLDGTLVDSSKLIVSSIRFAVRQRGKRIPSRKEVMDQYHQTPSPRRILSKFKVYDIEEPLFFAH